MHDAGFPRFLGTWRFQGVLGAAEKCQKNPYGGPKRLPRKAQDSTKRALRRAKSGPRQPKSPKMARPRGLQDGTGGPEPGSEMAWGGERNSKMALEGPNAPPRWHLWAVSKPCRGRIGHSSSPLAQIWDAPELCMSHFGVLLSRAIPLEAVGSHMRP